MPDPKVIEKYVRSVVERLEKEEEESLTKNEKRIGTKLKEAQDKADQLSRDMGQLRETIQQGQNRLQEMGRTHLEVASKAAGFIESLVSLRFGDEIEEEIAKKKASEGNGSKDPSVVKPETETKVRKKRIKKSKGRQHKGKTT
jgi:hypothetical protein